jgi:agmatinase
MPLTGPFLSRDWMGSTETMDAADWVMVGLPFDGTTSNRPGARFGPSAVREASWGLELYSPKLDASLDQVAYFDAGDLEFPLGNRDACLDQIRTTTREVLAAGKKWLGIGGEHLVTLPVIEAYLETYPNLVVIHFDAHADLRDDYLGEKLSHATVMRRIADLIGPSSLVQIGIRSGPQDEFAWMHEHRTLLKGMVELIRVAKALGDSPVFITVDLDVLDPSVLPGTGTPEPDGMTFGELTDWLARLRYLNIVGCDAVELAPHYDPSGVSSAVAAKVIRELLLLNADPKKHSAFNHGLAAL